MKNQFTFIFLFFVVACSTVPVTGRKQMTLIPSSQINNLSNDTYRQTIGDSKLSANQEQVQMVKRSGERISKAVEKYLRENGFEDMIKEFNWEFNLIEDPSVNAWCMPGGKVAFYTGILPVCRDETGVAVVMGHEIAHAVARHGNERMTHGLAQQGGGVVLAVALRDQPVQTKNLFMASYGAVSTVGAILPFSRKHESEADRLGLKFMAMAGYDPREAPRFWERMEGAASSKGSAQQAQSVDNTDGAKSFAFTPSADTNNKKVSASNKSNLDVSGFLSTHPSHNKRISDLNKWMPEALKYYNKH